MVCRQCWLMKLCYVFVTRWAGEVKWEILCCLLTLMKVSTIIIKRKLDKKKEILCHKCAKGSLTFLPSSSRENSKRNRRCKEIMRKEMVYKSKESWWWYVENVSWWNPVCDHVAQEGWEILPIAKVVFSTDIDEASYHHHEEKIKQETEDVMSWMCIRMSWLLNLWKEGHKRRGLLKKYKEIMKEEIV